MMDQMALFDNASTKNPLSVARFVSFETIFVISNNGCNKMSYFIFCIQLAAMKKNIGYPDWLYNNTALNKEYEGVRIYCYFLLT